MEAEQKESLIRIVTAALLRRVLIFLWMLAR